MTENAKIDYVAATSLEPTIPWCDVRDIASADIERHLCDLRYSGYTRVRNVLPTPLIAALKMDIETAYAGRSDRQYQNLSVNQAADRFVYNLQYRAKPYIDLLTIRPVSQLVMPFLNDPHFTQIPKDKPNYLLAYYNARMSIAALPLHLDTYMPFPGPHTFSMQVIFILDDQTLENGCSLIVPGSHRLGEFPDRTFEGTVPLESKAGDMIVWDSRLWHGAGGNTLGHSRWSLIATFRMWWAKQTMDIPRGTPAKVYDRISDEQKALLGFCSIPPKNESERISMKVGYADLKPHVSDYLD